jgi:hypothetical protein
MTEIAPQRRCMLIGAYSPHQSAEDRFSATGTKKIRIGESSMKSFTTLIVGGLVVALGVVGYLYYQRTANDITIQLPKVSLTK